MTEQNSVAFDFEGSLKLARELWAFAAFLKQTAKDLDLHAADVRETWTGRFANDFDKKIDNETMAANRTATQLETAATVWAKKWKEATDLQNSIKRIAEISVQTGLAAAGQEVVEVPPVPTVLAPEPPSFVPTQGTVS